MERPEKTAMPDRNRVWKAAVTAPKPMNFIIEQAVFHNMKTNEKTVGFYLYVYENGRCTHDYLQDTLEQARSQAFEDFHVPVNAWKVD